jgi:hypothetical protein
VDDQQRREGEHEQRAEHERATTYRPARVQARDPPMDHATMMRSNARLRGRSWKVVAGTQEIDAPPEKVSA